MSKEHVIVIGGSSRRPNDKGHYGEDIVTIKFHGNLNKHLSNEQMVLMELLLDNKFTLNDTF